MDIEINNQGAAVVEPKNKNPEMPLRYQLQMELLANQNSRLMEQRDKLLDMVELLQSKEEQEPRLDATVTMVQTPVGYAKVGDIVSYNRYTKQVRFGKVYGFTKEQKIVVKNCFCVEFGQDQKQIVYQVLDTVIDPSCIYQIA